ncbi:MAG: MarR family transcriptional regulator [Oribacterium sp.]
MIHVAIVSPDHSLEPIDEVISETDFGCQFYKYIYRKMSDIDDIYEDCREKCDVIFFSGELGYHYIMHKFPDIRIPCAFTAYEPIDVLSILLNFQIEHPETPLHRVFCDFLTATNHYMEVPQYLPAERCPVFYTDTRYDYRHITGFAKELWDSGRIDMILTRSINNLKRLEALKIPCIGVFPSAEMIRKSIRTALNELRLNTIQEKEELNILIRLPFSEEIEQEEQEYREATVYKLLADYRKAKHLHFSIDQGFNQFELHAQVPQDTDSVEFLRPILLDFRKKLSFPFRIGAGIGSSRERSRYFSEHALLEANRYGRNDAFFVGEEGVVTGPLSAETKLIYNYSNEKALEFARVQGINETNILKLISMFQQDAAQLLSSQNISKLLGITPRSASRILSKLLELGIVRLADPSEHGRAGHQGRPTYYFHFNKDAFTAALL